MVMDSLLNDQHIDRQVFRIIKNTEQRLTLGTLIRKLCKTIPGMDSRKIKNSVRRLIDAGELNYTYLYGSSWIEVNYSRPCTVSKNIIVAPSFYRQLKTEDRLVVYLEPGSSFGLGDHPTTRLALKGLDFLMERYGLRINKKKPLSAALDIGTGTAILAISAVLLGWDYVFAFDLDECAVYEAKKNIELNNLSSKIEVGMRWPDQKRKFELIMANLRFPTIKNYADLIKQSLAQGSFLLLSGIRPAELDRLDRVFSPPDFVSLWHSDEKGWDAKIYHCSA